MTNIKLEELNEIERELVQVAIASCERAYSPINKISIGSAVLTDKEEIVPGANYGISSGLNICAERAAIVTANSLGHTSLTILALASAADEPLVSCGPCRQFIYETGKRNNIAIQIITSNKDGSVVQCFTIDELFPFPYSRQK